MRSPSEERVEADIAALEAQLAELEVANKFEECAVLMERIEQMKKAQKDMSGLKAQLGKARAMRDFKACANIQKQIEGLKVEPLRLSLGGIAHAHTPWYPSVTTPANLTPAQHFRGPWAKLCRAICRKIRKPTGRVSAVRLHVKQMKRTHHRPRMSGGSNHQRC